MRLMVDLDGVVYDFVDTLTYWCRWREGMSSDRLPYPASWDFYRDQWGLTLEEFLAIGGRAVDDGYLFAEGYSIEGAIDGLHALRDAGHTIHIATDRSYGSRSVENTERWLTANAVPYDSLTFGRDKSVVDADIYIDDRDKNVEALRAAGKSAVIFDQPWNQNVDGPRVYDWPEFVSFVETVA